MWGSSGVLSLRLFSKSAGRMDIFLAFKIQGITELARKHPFQSMVRMCEE
jgi:hypothetical protein